MFTQAVAGVRHATVVAAGLLMLLVAACGTVPESPTGPAVPENQSNSPAESAPPETPKSEQPEGEAPGGPVELRASVEDKAKDVKVDTVVQVAAKYGTLTEVSLTHAGTDSPKMDVPEVSGTLSKDKTSWTAGSALDPSATYTLKMAGKNAAGEQKSETVTFNTAYLDRSKQTFVNIYPKDNQKVGVGMPAVLTFDVPVKDRAEFEKHLSVSTSPNQEGSWHWFSDTEVHFRPKAYWKAGTKITVSANLNGVNAGDGVYGQNTSSKTYSVGKSVITKVDLKKKTAVVEIDGKKARTIKISAGKKGYTTRSGTKLIMDKLATTRMDSETVAIGGDEAYNLKVKWALRITQSGEFLHAAPWNEGKFGKTNASHGCTGMSTKDAAWLFERVQVGDPVITTGNSREVEKGNGWSDWDLTWKKYQEGSAL